MPDEKISGEVEHIVYYNEENGYCVFELSAENELIVVTGSFPALSPGESLEISGQFVNHATHGEQFKSESFERRMPTGINSIFNYLSSGIIKGIGPSTAKKIVDLFGEKALDIIEQTPEMLTKIKGITKEKAKKYSTEFKTLFGMKTVLSYLAKYDIEPRISILLFKKFGGSSLDAIRENPFLLCREDIGAEFELADRIRIDSEMPDDIPCRLRASLSYILSVNADAGHTCLPKEKLVEKSVLHTRTDRETVVDALNAELDRKILRNACLDGAEYIFLPPYFNAEVSIAKRLALIANSSADTKKDYSRELMLLEKREKIEYAELQKDAIISAVSLGNLILTGGPGTGKTTTIKGIISLFEHLGFTVGLCAPTGRAAKRMTELTGRDAKTIHRFLEVSMGSGGLSFNKNEENNLAYDVVIVDEFSMVDVLIFDALLSALKPGARIILVGDEKQLPSVGAGNLLSDIIFAGAFNFVRLTEIFRQSKESRIVMAAHSVLSGELPELTHKDKDFFFLSTQNSNINGLILDLAANRLKKAYGYDPISDIQILCPSKIAESGTHALNKTLQSALNPHTEDKAEYTFNQVTFREGDKVMQTKNNYDIPFAKSDGSSGLGIFNGDIGIIRKINILGKYMEIDFDDRSTHYHFIDLGELDLCYAMTVHKSQGSEFDVVILSMPDMNSRLYFRNLFYTAITRAKKLLIIVGNQNAVVRSIENDRKSKRYTALKYYLLGTYEFI